MNLRKQANNNYAKYRKIIFTFTSLIMIAAATGCGGGGSGQASSETPTPQNTAPNANAGADITVTVDESVTVTGEGSDAEGNVSFTWVQTSGESVDISEPNSSTLTFVAPSMVGILIFELSVTDSDGLVAKDTVEITIEESETDPNPVPTPNTGDYRFRVSQVKIDYDNNGIFEGTSTRNYNEEGYLQSYQYEHIEDGTEDIAILGYISTFSDDASFTYDSMNRVSVVEFEIDGVRWEIETEYESEYVLAGQMDVIGFQGNEIESETAITYENGKLVSWYKTTIGDSGVGDTAYEFIYNNAGQLIERNSTISNDLNFTYTWYENGLVKNRSAFSSVDNTPSDTHDYFYDEAGDLIEYRYVSFDDNANSFFATFHYETRESYKLLTSIEYDEYDNGTIDAVIELIWVDEACVPSAIWANFFSTPVFVDQYPQSDSVDYGTGWGMANYCGSR